MPREQTEIYEFGGFRLDVGEHKLVRLEGQTGRSIPEKAFLTLVHLVRNGGTLLTKDELLETVWPQTAVEENNLAKTIYAIRRFLHDINGTRNLSRPSRNTGIGSSQKLKGSVPLNSRSKRSYMGKHGPIPIAPQRMVSTSAPK
jgi:DNA-binding response OmpR family regulator